jgi:hypothetical protein
MSYGVPAEKKALSKAIPALKNIGFKFKEVEYVLYNFQDSPQDFLNKLCELAEWGVVAYPMRYKSLDSLKKNQHVDVKWTSQQLEMVAHARRVIGYGGAFPTHDGLRKKFLGAKDFEEAFTLRPEIASSRLAKVPVLPV